MITQKNIYRKFDVAIGETNNGGEIAVDTTNNVKVIWSYENVIYLSLFGGNVNSESWFANDLLFETKEEKYLSETETALNTNSLTSLGRVSIQNAVERDLEYLRPYAEINVTVTIPTLNTIKIIVNTIWNTGEKMISTFTVKENSASGSLGNIDFSLDFSNDFY